MDNMTTNPASDEKESDLWESFRKRAEAVRQKTKKIQKLSEEEKTRIFLERSEKLRCEKGKSAEEKDLVKVISFHVAGEFFGIEVAYLQEVYEVHQVTKIPCTPPVLVGLINYRGTVLTIINLRTLFNLSDVIAPEAGSEKNKNDPSAQPTEKILIVAHRETKAGIVIDKLDNLLELPKDAICPVSSFFHDKNKIIKSEAKINDLPMLFIDPIMLLKDERLIVNEDV